MIKDNEKLIDHLLNFLTSSLLTLKKEGVVVYLDGTLMSYLYIKIVEKLTKIHKVKYVVTAFSSNKNHYSFIKDYTQINGLTLEFFDLSGELNFLSPFLYSKGNFELEIAAKKRLTDTCLNFISDQENLVILGNLSYNQWCLDFPHKAYKNRDHIYLFNSLLYSELKQLATYLQIDQTIINNSPTHNLVFNKNDQDILGFSNEQLEEFLHKQSVQNIIDLKIRNTIVDDSTHRFICPLFSRPSNLLSSI